MNIPIFTIETGVAAYTDSLVANLMHHIWILSATLRIKCPHGQFFEDTCEQCDAFLREIDS